MTPDAYTEMARQVPAALAVIVLAGMFLGFMRVGMKFIRDEGKRNSDLHKEQHKESLASRTELGAIVRENIGVMTEVKVHLQKTNGGS